MKTNMKQGFYPTDIEYIIWRDNANHNPSRAFHVTEYAYEEDAGTVTARGSFEQCSDFVEHRMREEALIAMNI